MLLSFLACFIFRGFCCISPFRLLHKKVLGGEASAMLVISSRLVALQKRKVGVRPIANTNDRFLAYRWLAFWVARQDECLYGRVSLQSASSTKNKSSIPQITRRSDICVERDKHRHVNV